MHGEPLLGMSWLIASYSLLGGGIEQSLLWKLTQQLGPEAQIDGLWALSDQPGLSRVCSDSGNFPFKMTGNKGTQRKYPRKYLQEAAEQL